MTTSNSPPPKPDRYQPTSLSADERAKQQDKLKEWVASLDAEQRENLKALLNPRPTLYLKEETFPHPTLPTANTKALPFRPPESTFPNPTLLVSAAKKDLTPIAESTNQKVQTASEGPTTDPLHSIKELVYALDSQPQFGGTKEAFIHILKYVDVAIESRSALGVSLRRAHASYMACVEELSAMRSRKENWGEAFKFDLGNIMAEAHKTALEKGWWDDDKAHRSEAELIALMHSELSEALEAWRDQQVTVWFGIDKPNKPEGMLTEYADVIIRIGDALGRRQCVPQFLEALRLKMEYNKTRPYRHGGKQA